MATKWLMTDQGFCLTAENAAMHSDTTTETQQQQVVDSRDEEHEEGLPPSVSCSIGCNVTHGVDASQPAAQVAPPLSDATIEKCCAACKENSACESFVLGGKADEAGAYPYCW